MKTKLPIFTGILALCGMLTVGHAATVSWATNNITGDSNVLAPTGMVLDGAFALVANGGTVGAPNVNGTLFSQVSITTDGTNIPSVVLNAGDYTLTFGNVAGYNGAPSGNTAFNALNSGMQALLTSYVYGNASTTPTLSIGGLTSGTTYTIRFFDQENLDGNQNLTWTSGATSSTPGPIGAGGTNALGSYFDATFTADSSTEDFTFSSAYHPSINGLEVFETAAVPEPSTVALLSMACGLIGFVAVRRFRLAAV